MRSRDLPLRTRMEVMNELFRQGYDHQYIYDYETLALRLTEAGFVGVTRADFGRGQLPELLVDQAARRFESLYVEARRPPAEGRLPETADPQAAA